MQILVQHMLNAVLAVIEVLQVWCTTMHGYKPIPSKSAVYLMLYCWRC